MPGRGAALKTPDEVAAAIAGTQGFLTKLYETVAAGKAAGRPLKDVYDETMAALTPDYGDWVIFEHCMPFDVARAWDEAGGVEDPRVWTAERDREMWAALERDGETA